MDKPGGPAQQAPPSTPSLHNVEVERPHTPRTPRGALTETRRNLLLTIASAVVIAAVAAVATFQLRSPAASAGLGAMDASGKMSRGLADTAVTDEDQLQQVLAANEDQFQNEISAMMRQMATATQAAGPSEQSAMAAGDSFTGDQYATLFLKFLSHYAKKYTLEEFASRLKLFKNSVDLVYTTNSNPSTPYTLAVNEFADLTESETENRMGLRPISDEDRSAFEEAFPLSEIDGSQVQALPASVDWRTMGVVTPVKNQGSCGSCWSFGATQSIESMWALGGNGLTALSEQQLLDCVTQSNYGCNGGFPFVAQAWVQTNGGITSAANYPYAARQGTCRRGMPAAARIKGYYRLPKNDEASLLAAVAIQPVVVCVYASERGFSQYKTGVFTGSCGTQVNHAVLAVGYGVENGIPYWLIKNSWGASWGASGYIKIRRNLGGIGMCGITSMSSYPTSFTALRAYSSNSKPTVAPTVRPTVAPTAAPTPAPTYSAAPSPTAAPTTSPSAASCSPGYTGIVCSPKNCCPYFRMCSNGYAYPQQATAPGTVCYGGQIVFKSDPRCATVSC